MRPSAAWDQGFPGTPPSPPDDSIRISVHQGGTNVNRTPSGAQAEPSSPRTPASHRGASPAFLAACFAGAAAIWLLLAHFAVAVFAADGPAPFAQGVLFLFGTTWLCWLLLRRQRADGASGSHPAEEGQVALDRAHRDSAEMKLLIRRLLNAQELERRDIARQLHDQLGQTLTVARLLVESTLDQIEDKDASAVLREAMEALESGMKETRALTGMLRPPMLDDLGLVPTLRWLVDRSVSASGIEAVLDLPPDPGPLASEIDVAAYRIAQEAIDNALRHGEPRRLRVRLRIRDRVLTLTVDDDGRGFDPDHVLEVLVPFGRSGLLGIRERAEALGGGVRIRSRPGQGTVVRAILPRRPEVNPAGNGAVLD